MRGDQGSNGTSGNRIQFRFREKIEFEVFSQRGGAVHSRLQGGAACQKSVVKSNKDSPAKFCSSSCFL